MLNAKKLPKSTGGNRVKQEPLEIGSFEARLVGIVDMGMQDRSQGKFPKEPAHMIRFTYEVADEFMVDENGVEQEDKPRWLSEEFPFNSLDKDLATSTKRYRAIDPEDSCDGDFPALLGMPLMLGVGQYKKTVDGEEEIRNKVTGVTTITKKKAAKMPELVNEPQLFLLADPDMELFNQLPEWLRDKIKGNMEYRGSKLEALIEGKPVPEDKADDEDDIPMDEEAPEQSEAVEEDGEEEDWLED